MGRAIVAQMSGDPTFANAGGIGRGGGEGPEPVGLASILASADVVLDFSTAAAAAELALFCAESGGPPLVIGATGFSLGEAARIKEAARRIPIVRSGNYSIGVNILVGLVARLAGTLPPEIWDIEILEAHHRRKIDAPSGTALMLGEAAAFGRGVPLEAVERRGRDGITGPRAEGEIGFSILRAGGIVGEHSVVFAADDEVISLHHSALDRSMFARGALAAARWIVGREPGEFSMQDVLGFHR